MTTTNHPPQDQRKKRFIGLKWLRPTTPPIPELRPSSLEQKAGPISKLFFWWIYSIVKSACLRRLELNDFPFLDSVRTSKAITSALEKNLHYFSSSGRRLPLLRAVEKTCRFELWLACSLQAASIIVDYANVVPHYFLWKYLVRCQNARDDGTPQPSFGEGIAYIATIVAAVAINNISLFHGRYRANMIGAQIRSAVVALVSKKAYTIDPNVTLRPAPGKSNQPPTLAGDTSTAYTLCNVYADRLNDLVADMVTILRSLLNYPLAIALFAWLLGWIAAVILAMMITIQAAAFTLLSRALRQRRVADALSDHRVAQLESMFSGIRLVKYFGWEDFFLKRIQQVRLAEAKANKHLVLLNVFWLGAWTWSITWMSLVAYGLYASQHSLYNKPAIVISAVTLVCVDRNSSRLIRSTATFLTAWPAFLRLQEMLSAPDSDYLVTTVALPSVGHAVELENAQFLWHTFDRLDSSEGEAKPKAESEKQTSKEDDGASDNESNRFVLAPLSLEIRSGDLVAIVGPSQAGKSSVLSGLIREMPLRGGQLRVDGLPAHCPQKAWIQSASVKENILFGQAFNQAIYDNVLDSCALRPDLDTFPRGDLSELGERGINLSGGQQHRVHLARTLYQALVDQRHVVILDDPLSAVDAITSSVIFDKAISEAGLLASKTRILATHQLQYLSRCNRVIFMRDGRIIADGTFQDLMALSSFQEFVGEHKQNEQAKSENVAATEVTTDAVPLAEFSDADARVIMNEERANHKVPSKFYLQCIGGTKNKIKFTATSFVSLISQVCFALLSLQTAWWTSDRFGLSTTENVMISFGLTILHACTWGPYEYLIQAFWLERSVAISFEALDGVLRAPIAFFNANPIGRLINRFASDIAYLDTLFLFNYWQFSMLCFYGSVQLVIVLTYLPIVTSLLFPWVACGVFIFTIFKATPLEIKRLSTNLQSAYLTLVHEGLDGRTTISLAKHEDNFRDRIYEKMDEHNSVHFISFATAEWAAMMHTTTYALIMFCSGLILLHSRFDRTPSVLVIVYALFGVTATMLSITLEQGTNTQKGVNAMERLNHFAHELPDEGERSAAKSQTTQGTAEKTQSWPSSGQVSFKQVSLRYKKTLPMVLKDVTFNVAGGEKIGIVGRTGAGKSTLLMAILRMYSLASGSISIDERDITELGLHDVRHAIATIPQDPVMFIASVRFNLDPTGTISDEKLLQALERVHLIGYRAEGKPGSLTLDTHVTEGGGNFSSGQRQLLSLARALAKGSKIIIIDEATSNVDLAMDTLVQQTIKQVFADCTVMTIAHRLRSVLRYDRVVVMHKGSVAEMGPPKELFLKPGGGDFRSLCDQADIELRDFSE